MPQKIKRHEIATGWRVGFELEVVLGDLGNPRFSDYEPMDTATASYCQFLAKQLSSLTGEKWSAPRKTGKKTGFYVVPEYDIDPINFRYNYQLAGVELITPPLPISEAEDLRQRIVYAISELDGYDNADHDELTSGLGWHINIDPGNTEREMLAARFATAVDEIEMLKRSHRLGGKFTGLQRHSFGPLLLNEIRTPQSFVRPDINLQNFIENNAGITKYFAANFSRDSYLELRHFGTPEFFGSDSLEYLIGEPIRAFQMDHKSTNASLEHLFATFQILGDWLDVYREKLNITKHEPGMSSTRFATLLFDKDEIGIVEWSGRISLQIWGAQQYETVVGTWGQAHSDLAESFAVLCLDLAEILLARGAVDLATDALGDAVSNLADRIESAGLVSRPRKERGSWWDKKYV